VSVTPAGEIFCVHLEGEGPEPPFVISIFESSTLRRIAGPTSITQAMAYTILPASADAVWVDVFDPPDRTAAFRAQRDGDILAIEACTIESRETSVMLLTPGGDRVERRPGGARLYRGDSQTGAVAFQNADIFPLDESGAPADEICAALSLDDRRLAFVTTRGLLYIATIGPARAIDEVRLEGVPITESSYRMGRLDPPWEGTVTRRGTSLMGFTALDGGRVAAIEGFAFRPGDPAEVRLWSLV
jgi:hypothetical protein